MDDNSTNDFKGPDQKLYKDSVEFGNSCKWLKSMYTSLVLRLWPSVHLLEATCLNRLSSQVYID